ncbi:MAG: histone deacetylase family protein [Candidatus Acetothermia bacterium]
MDIVFDAECLQYRSAGHPESPERVKVSYNILREEEHATIKPEKATEEDLATVHLHKFIDKVKQGNFSNPDCPHYTNLMHYALLAAGGAITAQQEGGFSLMRPPGHHAGKDFLGGFCYFNNLAVAVKRSDLQTVIVDFDGHHGNGTQDIFYEDDQVTYISLHRSYGFPGTGKRSRKNIINVPLEVNCGDEKYLENFQDALDKAPMDQFEQIAVSAGFDTHKNDPLASLGLSRSTYRRIGEILFEYGLPTFAVLEGGYKGQDLGHNIDAFLKGFK